MKRLIMFCLLTIGSLAVLAQDNAPNPCADISATANRLNLSAMQLKAFAANCQNAAQSAVEVMTSTQGVETVSQWGGVAKEFAQAIGIAAKELGIAVNDFLDSPAGYLMAVILMVKYAGALVIGIPYTLFSGLCLYWVLNKLRTKEITYEYRSALWGLFEYRRKLKVTMREELPEHIAFYGVVAIAFTLISNMAVWINATG